MADTDTITDVEVDPEQALAEGGLDPIDQADVDQIERPQDAQQEAPQESPQDVIDIIQPKAEPKEWTLGTEDTQQMTYIQEPLSYFGKMQWFGLVGEVIDHVVSGEDGVSVGQFFDMPDIAGLRSGNFSEADTFIQAVGKILVYAPDFLEKSYCIWLNIPEHQRPWARAMMNERPEKGGFTDDEGIEIMEIFIDQNWEAIERFFREHFRKIRDRVQARREENQTEGDSPLSMPSNTTPPTTPSA